MFKKSRKDAFVEQAQDLAHDISEALAPHVERAKDELAPRLADARDAVAPKLSDARDAVAPKLSDARDAVGPVLADARDQAAPYVESARERFVKDVVPAVQQAVSDARDQAAPVAEEAKRRGGLAAAALKGEPVKRSGGKRKLVLLAALAGVGAFVFSKVKGGQESTNWQSSYTPTPATPPAPPAPPAKPAAKKAAPKPSGAHAADGPAAGANPGETLSDAAEAPHEATTPDAPAETVDVADKDTPSS